MYSDVKMCTLTHIQSLKNMLLVLTLLAYITFLESYKTFPKYGIYLEKQHEYISKNLHVI